MNSIFISHAASDRDLARSIASKLNESGHEVLIDEQILTPGINWRQALSEGLKKSDVFIVLISENSLKSRHVLSEIGSARAYALENGRMLIIPVVLDGVEAPEIISDLFYIQNQQRDVKFIIKKIEAAITGFIGKRAAKDKENEVANQKLEDSATQFIEDAIRSLKSREEKDSYVAAFWHGIGFLALLLAVAYAGYSSYFYNSHLGYSGIELIVLLVKSVVIVGLLAGCSRYAFILGKNYKSEALKNADRTHAIEFGKFYLRAYGSRATWVELKEAFQHWNIDRPSSFSAQDVSGLDGKSIEHLIDLVKAAKGDGK